MSPKLSGILNQSCFQLCELQTAGRDLFPDEVELRSVWIALVYLTLEQARWPQKIQRPHEISARYMVRCRYAGESESQLTFIAAWKKLSAEGLKVLADWNCRIFSHVVEHWTELSRHSVSLFCSINLPWSLLQPPSAKSTVGNTPPLFQHRAVMVGKVFTVSSPSRLWSKV